MGINWQPDFKNYLGRPPTLAQQLPSMNNACPGWPTSLTSPLVWDGEELKNKRNHIYELNLEEKADIYEALKHFRGEAIFIPRYASLVQSQEFWMGSNFDPVAITCSSGNTRRGCQNSYDTIELRSSLTVLRSLHELFICDQGHVPASSPWPRP